MIMSMANDRVTMIRHNLSNIPQHTLPSDYVIRWHRAGDRETWVRIHALAEKYVQTTAQVFDEQFGGDERELARRQAFVVDSLGREIGTATAWFNDDYHGQKFGRVHWVAIVPENQGKGLAKPLMTAICNRLVELSHERAYLATSTARLPAINLYLGFRFEPEIWNEEDRRAWAGVSGHLKQKL